MSIYGFIRGINVKLGVGVKDLGFERPSTLPVNSMYGPRYNVHRSFGPQAPAFAKLSQQVVSVDFLGTTGLSFPMYPRGQRLMQPSKGS